MKDEMRLYNLIMQSIQGDADSYVSIINRFSGLIEKESYNSYTGVIDEDLRSEIYLALFIRIQRFKIYDNATFASATESQQ